jgi:hypothetical protein
VSGARNAAVRDLGDRAGAGRRRGAHGPRATLAVAVAVAITATGWVPGRPAAVGAAAAQALVERSPPPHRVVHRGTLAVRGNPTGLIFDGRVSYRRRLHASESLALRDNYAGGGAALTLSPAFVRIGPYVEVAPASFLTLWAAAQVSRYFGALGLLQSFGSPVDDFSDRELARRRDLDDGDPLASYAATGLEVTVGLDLQARWGPLAVRAQSRLVRGSLALRGADRVYYDQVVDLLLRDDGLALVADVDVAHFGVAPRRAPGLVVGLRYSAGVPRYRAADYPAAAGASHDNSSHRLGPVIGYTLFSRDGAAWNAPTVLLVTQWWIDHRYRAGAESSRALPLVALALRFHGDLLALPPRRAPPAVSSAP